MESILGGKSNRMIYAENREKYFEQVIAMFESGMVAKEIIKVVPVGKSTVYRWYDEYIATNKDASIRKSPKEAAEVIRQLRSRVAQLERKCVVDEDAVVLEKAYIKALQNEIAGIATDIATIAGRLSSLEEKLNLIM